MLIDRSISQEAPPSVARYALSLAKSGIRVLPGSSGTFWFKHESGAMMRMPNFYVAPPTSREIQRVLWCGRAAIASYLIEPDERHQANALLYLCTDQAYALDKLTSNARRDVRRGLREVTIEPLTSEQVLTHGLQAFCDTRQRNGLRDGTPKEFRRWFTDLAKLPEVVYLGAWKNEQLAAFATITEMDDWVDFGCFSMDALRRYTPNDALVYSIVSCYLVERRYRLVSYGLSSVQKESNEVGLHKFKLKLGFETKPVHRAFIPHPLLRSFINRLTLWGMNILLRLKPGDRRLKKAIGVLTFMLEDVRGLKVGEGV